MQVPKQQIRDRILEAAIDEFYQFGYKDASMRRIAAAAGITPGNIYAYFPGKQELFAHIMNQTMEDMREFVRTVSRGRGIDSALLHEIAGEVVQIYLQHKRQFLILMSGSAGTDCEDTRPELLAIISEAIQQQQILSEQPEQMIPPLSQALANALLSGVLQLIQLYADDERSLTEAIDRFMQLIFSGTQIASIQ